MASAAAENQAFFNKIANEYDQKYGTALVQLEKELKAKRDFIGFKQGGRLLDYACGTGLISTSLAGDVGEAIGIDISEKMVGAYNAKARAQGVPPEVRTAHLGHLIDPSDPSPSSLSNPKFFDFDVAGVGLAWHHLDDCGLAAKRLAERLKPGGVLFIMDFAPHEQLDPALAAGHGVQHHGFSREQIRAMFQVAGVGKDFAYAELEDKIVFRHAHGEGKHMERTIFVARGTKE